MANLIQSKRFVVRQSLIGKDTNVEVSFKNGKSVTYSHDKAFEIMKETLEALACWEKYKSYTSSGNVPKSIRDTEAILESSEAEVVVDEVVEETEDITSEAMTPAGAF